MGVMNCYRMGCNNIMCDTYVTSIGYVCYECQREFKEHLIEENISIKSREDIVQELKKFLDIDKRGNFDKGEGKIIMIDDFFKEYTR